MDGARLLNASVVTGVPAKTFAAMVDSVWIDFTKGLGAPIGAVPAGTAPSLPRRVGTSTCLPEPCVRRASQRSILCKLAVGAAMGFLRTATWLTVIHA
jgi:hypothetical protein